MPEKIAKVIMELSERMRRLKAMQEDQASDVVLSDREFMILDLLDQKGKMTVSELAAAEPDVSYSTISTCISNLWRDRKMLTKTVEPDNQRVTMVDITRKGRDAVKILRQQRSDRFKKLFEAINLTDNEKEVLVKVLDRAIAYFDSLVVLPKGHK